MKRKFQIAICIAAISLLYSYENKFSYVNTVDGTGKVILENNPVFTEREPVEFTTPSFLSTARVTILSTSRFRCTLEGLIPNSLSCKENFSVTALPTT